MRRLIQALLRPFHLRLVNLHWGPRGPWAVLERVRQRGLPVRQIVDVGASDGVWTRDCLRIFAEARYLLVDPLPGNAAALAAMQAAHSNVRYWQGGLGRAAGRLNILQHGDQSSFLPSDSFPANQKTTVEIRTLDSFLGTPDLPSAPDLIKADVQGYELEVLAGASRCLESAQLVLLEVSYRRIYRGAPLAHEVIAEMGRRGFRIYDIATYAQRPGDGELAQSDVFFAPEGSPLFQREDWF